MATDADRARFEALLQPLLRSAFGTAFHLTRNAADAEDLVQEAALNAFKGFSSFQPGTNFRAWFFRILVNCVYSHHRRTRRQATEVELDEAPALFLYQETSALGLHSQVEDPASALMDRLDGEAVTAALDALPHDFRVVATLFFVEDLAYQEIAHILECPVGTVRSRLHRARRLLQQQLWRVAGDRGFTNGLANAKESS